MQPLERSSQGIFSALTAGLTFTSHNANSSKNGKAGLHLQRDQPLKCDMLQNVAAVFQVLSRA